MSVWSKEVENDAPTIEREGPNRISTYDLKKFEAIKTTSHIFWQSCKDCSNQIYNSTQANQREEEYKNQIKTLTTRLKEVWIVES